jgi:hypothetical protein
MREFPLAATDGPAARTLHAASIPVEASDAKNARRSTSDFFIDSPSR